MKKCPYCGRENDDAATRCVQCGSAAFAQPAPAPAPDATASWVKVAVLGHEVEAERLDVELTSRNIPHVMRSYHDSALDGLFQSIQGWGAVLAPGDQKSAILAILNDIRLSCEETGEGTP
jgi:hypothetical protein